MYKGVWWDYGDSGQALCPMGWDSLMGFMDPRFIVLLDHRGLTAPCTLRIMAEGLVAGDLGAPIETAGMPGRWHPVSDF